ncbi:TPA: hypothetical protein ACXIIX_001963 [Clostridioides difficile]|nr:hypothetical protein [Clostridioides difficile]
MSRIERRKKDRESKLAKVKTNLSILPILINLIDKLIKLLKDL